VRCRYWILHAGAASAGTALVPAGPCDGARPPQVAASAYLNLAAIHTRADQPLLAQQCREQAYRRQRVFIEQTGKPVRRLLLCEGSGSSNVPLDTLLGTGLNTRIKYVLDFAAEAEDLALPDYDLVFNAIGDPDISPALQQRLKGFEARCQRPLLNRPEEVERTQRQHLPPRLNGIPGVVMPPCIRLDAAPATKEALRQRIQQSGIAFPVLFRPWASHGGKDMVRCDDLDSLWNVAGQAGDGSYVKAFHDFRSADGYFRKYRMIFIDGEPYPYHLAISSHWMVHYFSADMAGQPEKQAEEMRFLQDPATSLGEPAGHRARARAAICRHRFQCAGRWARTRLRGQCHDADPPGTRRRAAAGQEPLRHHACAFVQLIRGQHSARRMYPGVHPPDQEMQRARPACQLHQIAIHSSA